MPKGLLSLCGKGEGTALSYTYTLYQRGVHYVQLESDRVPQWYIDH